MKRMHWLSVITVILLAVWTTQFGFSQNVSFTVNAQGLQTLMFNGFNFAYTNPSFCLFGMSAPAITNNTTRLLSSSLDSNRNGTLLTYGWGTVHLQYGAASNKLTITATVSNATSGVLSNAALNIINLALPSAPPQYDGSDPLLNTIEQAPVVFLSYSNGAVAFVNENIQQPITSGTPVAENRPTNTIFQFMVNAGADSRYNPVYYGMMPPIASNATATYQVSLRFGGPSATPTTLAGDIFAKFANLYPFRLNWPDRRPIGMDGLSAATASSATNPRGWFNNPNADYISPAGMAQFRLDLLARADQEIAILKYINAQGVIIWDIEGTDLSISYVGDPRQLWLLAPEMNAVADEFLKKYTDAGFRVGLTVRPQLFTAGTNLPAACTNGQVFVNMSAPLGQQVDLCTNGGWVQTQAVQQEISDYGSLLMQKIQYARARWGATIFYIDSYRNIPPYYCYALTNIYAANPDILMLPERAATGYFSVTAPFSDPQLNGCSTPESALLVYPHAFSVVRVGPPCQFSDFLASAAQGNIFLLDTYYSNATTAAVQQAYANGALPAPAGVHVVTNGP